VARHAKVHRDYIKNVTRAKDGRTTENLYPHSEKRRKQHQVTSVDITGPYLQTPHRNKYLLTFIDHFAKYVEAFPIPDQTAEMCDIVRNTNCHSVWTGSKLITDKDRAFMSSCFKETCKILGIRKVAPLAIIKDVTE